MEILEEKIKKFLQISYGYGSGYGDGYGSGYGDGYGSGYCDSSGDGSGYGSGYGDGYGSGYGDGYGSGYCDGSGDGYGSGYGCGYGYGYGSGDGIKKFNDCKIYMIDNVPTIINHIHNNIAKGFILNRDFTTESCYVVKGHNLFAHGKTLQEARTALEEKIYNNLDVDGAIKEFRKKFNNTDKYKGKEFYTWHHILTGSCEMGRNSFVKNHNINLDDEFTVKEFIKICENDFGGKVIKQLKEFYN